MKSNKTFIIRNKETKELWEADSGKASWKMASHAKVAWFNSGMMGYFKDQEGYEVVESVSRCNTEFQKAKDLLTHCLGRLSDRKLEKEIEEFLNKNKERQHEFAG